MGVFEAPREFDGCGYGVAGLRNELVIGLAWR